MPLIKDDDVVVEMAAEKNVSVRPTKAFRRGTLKTAPESPVAVHSPHTPRDWKNAVDDETSGGAQPEDSRKRAPESPVAVHSPKTAKTAAQSPKNASPKMSPKNAAQSPKNVHPWEYANEVDLDTERSIETETAVTQARLDSQVWDSQVW